MILRYVTQIWILSLYVRSLSKSQVNPLHPKISMHILHTDHHTFSVTDKENLFNNQEIFLSCDHFLYSSYLDVWFNRDIGRRNWILIIVGGVRVNMVDDGMFSTR